MIKLFQSAILILSSFGAQGAPTDTQALPSLSEAFAQLQVEATSDRAMNQFLKMGSHNLSAHAYLAAHLAPVIDRGLADKPHVWLNAVRLAGEFQIKEAILSLANFMVEPSGTPQGATIAKVESLDPFPAAKSLVQIGEPAFPTLVRILRSGTHREKWVAYRALFLIGTPRATQELHDDVTRETDSALRLEIQAALQGRVAKP